MALNAGLGIRVVSLTFCVVVAKFMFCVWVSGVDCKVRFLRR